MIPYATPEWVEAMAKNYRDDPENANTTFKGLSLFITFRILADPRFGLDEDICFSTHIDDGVLRDDSALISKDDAERKSDFILSATPDIWKTVIKKEEGFVSAFMTGKIKLDKGDPAEVVALAPRSPAVVECFHNVEAEWPDEMSPQRLEQYKAQVREFRNRLGV